MGKYFLYLHMKHLIYAVGICVYLYYTYCCYILQWFFIRLTLFAFQRYAELSLNTETRKSIRASISFLFVEITWAIYFFYF